MYNCKLCRKVAMKIALKCYEILFNENNCFVKMCELVRVSVIFITLDICVWRHIFRDRTWLVDATNLEL